MAYAAAAGGIDLRGHTSSPTIALDRAQPSIDAFRRVLANLADEIDANREGTVDDIDPEFLHDLRVAVRRTRSVLAQDKRVLPPDGRGRFREEFGWLGALTGPTRDLDVYIVEWDSYVAPLGGDVASALEPLVRHLADRRRIEHVALATHLRGPRYHGLMTTWHRWLARRPTETTSPPVPLVRSAGLPPAGSPAPTTSLSPGAGNRAVHAGGGTARAAQGRQEAPLRAGVLRCPPGPGERKAFVQRLKGLQDNLGEHQDTEVHAAQLREMSHELRRHATTDADTLVAMGQLAGEFERRCIAPAPSSPSGSPHSTRRRPAATWRLSSRPPVGEPGQ